MSAPVKEDERLRLIIYVIFTILFILVTFFGLGPALMADGSDIERLATLAAVIVSYVILALLLRFFIRRFS